MKKATGKTAKPEMRPEYDFSRGVRGKYARRYDRGATAVAIRRLRGILKRKPGQEPLAKAMAAHKRAEKKLEEAKMNRLK